jgi:hypothetical protein
MLSRMLSLNKNVSCCTSAKWLRSEPFVTDGSGRPSSSTSPVVGS